MFRFESTVEGWAWGPNLEGDAFQQASLSESNGNQPAVFGTDEDGYCHIARVTADTCSLHGAVSYFVLKFIAVVREYKHVSAISPDVATKLTNSS